MELVKARFIESIARTPSVKSFRFTAEKALDFLPGEFMQVMFDSENEGNKDLNKYLSLSCSPFKHYIEVTKRISQSTFSQRLLALEKGDEILLKAPLGTCVYKDEYKKIAFVIGGIGITPVISIIAYIVDKGLGTDVHLVYSNRTEEEIAFKHELDSWESQQGNIKVCYTVTECQPKDKKCFFGHINEAMLCEHMKDIRERMVFIFGPPKMVEAMKKLCLDLGCSPENVKTEQFIGY